MRILIPGLCFALAAVPALAQNQAQTITPTDAKARVGQTVTVEGAVSAVHTGRSGATFIDIGGRYPENAFTAVIFVGDLAKFPGVTALDGRTVDINGSVQLYRGRPEIILKSAEQLTAK
jgi:DNA/RNA endonuclease YhcR with UshA esterase domain